MLISWKSIATQLTTILFTIILANAVDASSFESMCDSATTIKPNGSEWSNSYDDTQIFNIETTTAGILVLDVSSSEPSASSPRLVFLGRGCVEPGTAEDFTSVEQGAAYQVIAIREPGTYSLQVASMNVGLSLGEHHLQSSFTAAEIVEEEITLELGGGSWMLAEQTHFYTNTRLQKSEEDMVDPNPTQKSEEDSVDPNPTQKSEEDSVDPNPTASKSDRHPILSLITLRTTSLWKSEEDSVDPNPTFNTPQLDRGAIAGSLVLYSDELEMQGGNRIAGQTEQAWLVNLFPAD